MIDSRRGMHTSADIRRRLAALLAAAGCLAAAPVGAQSLTPNQESMLVAIKNPALPPGTVDPALCPSLGRKRTANNGLPAIEQALFDRCGAVVRETNAGSKATALQEITAE